MIANEAILEDPALEWLFGSFYLYLNLSELVNIWSHALFLPLHDASKSDHINWLSSPSENITSTTSIKIYEGDLQPHKRLSKSNTLSFP